MTTPIATITQAQYKACDAEICPVCQSTEVEYGEINMDTGCVTQSMDCLNCELEWYSMFTLVGYEPRHRTWPESAWSFKHIPEQFPNGICKDCGRDYENDVPKACSDDCPSQSATHSSAAKRWDAFVFSVLKGGPVTVFP